MIRPDKHRKRVGAITLCKVCQIVRYERSKSSKAEKFLLQQLKGRQAGAFTLDFYIEPCIEMIGQNDRLFQRWYMDIFQRLQLVQRQG